MQNNVFDNHGCFGFVLNPYVIEANHPFELAPGCIIDKATDEQSHQIKTTLSRAIGESYIWKHEDIYEAEASVLLKEDGSKSWQFEPLDKSDWRYYVVTTPDNGHVLHNVHYASNISNAALEISALTFAINNNGWRGARLGILHNHFFYYEPQPARRIDEAELRNIAEIYRDYVGLDDKLYPEIPRAMGMLDSLSFIAKNSPFQVIGLFSIIEILITHNPKLEDRGDSITHQMQAKIPLLSKRFQTPLDYSWFFGDAGVKKVWQGLYGYRSAVAHGGTPDFQSRDLKILKNSHNADSFLREVVKALLRQALKEPQLYKDLQSC